MASDTLLVTELIAVVALYCVLFCPILCWVITGSSSLTTPWFWSSRRNRLP